MQNLLESKISGLLKTEDKRIWSLSEAFFGFMRNQYIK